MIVIAEFNMHVALSVAAGLSLMPNYMLNFRDYMYNLDQQSAQQWN